MQRGGKIGAPRSNLLPDRSRSNVTVGQKSSALQNSKEVSTMNEPFLFPAAVNIAIGHPLEIASPERSNLALGSEGSAPSVGGT